MRGWLLSRKNGKGGERRAGAKVGHWAAKKMVRTGDRRLNLEVVSKEDPPHLGLLLSPGMEREGRVDKVGREEM